MTETRRLNEIIIGERKRRDLGDLDSLMTSIATIGLLHPIVITPQGQLVAGQRRLEACRQLGLAEVDVHVVDNIVSARDALIAERDENVQRKELTSSEAVALGEELEAIQDELAKERQRQAGKTYGRGKIACGKFPQAIEDAGKTRDKVGAALGRSGKIYEYEKKVVHEGVPELAQAVDRGDVAVSLAANATELPEDKQVEFVNLVDEGIKPKEALRRVKRSISKSEIALPTDKYRVFLVDPPWQYSDSGVINDDNYGRAERHYPTMSIDELCELPIKDMAEDNAVLFLWSTSPMLEDAFKVIGAWSFTYKTSFVWDKVKHNFGHYNSVRHEFLLVCTRGSCTPDSDKKFDSVQSIERTGKHSEKPEEFREIIDTLYTHGSKIELFAREEHRGWTTWGNEI